jgi:hypothetical protein
MWGSGMKQEVIFTWLGLPPENWPPDHYRLLGLAPGEDDVERIEGQVHERMERVRRYQLSHPELATEAMNRLAQALVCLTDPKAKKSYDASLGLAPAPPKFRAAVVLQKRFPRRNRSFPLSPWEKGPASELGRPVASAAAPTLPLMDRGEKTPPPMPALPAAEKKTGGDSSSRTVMDWAGVATPPPVRLPAANGPLLLTPPAAPADAKAAVPAEPAETRTSTSTPILVSAPADPVFETARTSPEATRGLGTRRALYHRLAQTRRLMRAWDQAGKYLARGKRRPNSLAEEADLVKQLTAIRDLLEEFPPLIGQPGQPGQHVAAIARQQQIQQTIQNLDQPQLDALAKDWLAGRTLLASHRRFLSLELQAHRKRSPWAKAVRAMRALINDHPGYVLLIIGLLALLVALVHI